MSLSPCITFAGGDLCSLCIADLRICIYYRGLPFSEARYLGFWTSWPLGGNTCFCTFELAGDRSPVLNLGRGESTFDIKSLQIA